MQLNNPTLEEDYLYKQTFTYQIKQFSNAFIHLINVCVEELKLDKLRKTLYNKVTLK